jgi:hypothetical protein
MSFDSSSRDKFKSTFERGYFIEGQVTGPINLYRLAGREEGKNHLNKRAGFFWFSEDLLFEAIELMVDGRASHSFAAMQMKRFLREVLAISYDWNSIAGYWKLALPSGRSVQALVGRAAEQPHYSVRSARSGQNRAAGADFAGDTLFGGDTQFVIEIDDKDTALQACISGPFPLSGASGRA